MSASSPFLLSLPAAVLLLLFPPSFQAEFNRPFGKVDVVKKNSPELEAELATELEDWEMRILKDFVRGKGKGFVSNESFEELIAKQQRKMKEESQRNKQMESEEFFLGSFGPSGGETTASANSNDVLNIMSMDTSQFVMPGGIIRAVHPKPPRSFRHHPVHRQTNPPVSSTLAPSSSSSRPTSLPESLLNLPEGTDFKSLASLFQQFIDRRQAELNNSQKVLTDIKQIEKPTRTSAFATIQPQRSHTTKVSTLRLPSNHQVNHKGVTRTEWQLMNPEETDPELEDARIPTLLPSDSTTMSHSGRPAETSSPRPSASPNHSPSRGHEKEWEKKVKELAEELAAMLRKMKKKKEEKESKTARSTRPRVTVIRNGTAEGLANRQYSLIATITLIQDGPLNILVDTGLATDINGRTQILKNLELVGVPPPAVSVVVSSHGHPDHTGNLHEFPDAVHYHSWFVHERTIFNLSSLFESNSLQLSPSVTVMRVPGHTSEDLAVLVRDAEGMGNVAVTGDVFMRREDINNSREWMPLSADEKSQSAARRTLLCQSNTIIPGHGPPFTVDHILRRLFKC